MSLKSEYCNIQLTVLGGEQTNVTVPFDNFVLTKDKKFLKEVESDKREEKVIYAYTDSGVSENGRDWKPSHMESIATQVVEKMPVGYLGHIKPAEYGYEFPEPQIVWFGSCTEELTDNTIRLWIKGYLLPTSEKLETWIKTKAVDSISVYGKITYKMKGKIMDIQDIDLKSIDIARKLGEGLNSGIAGIFGEMEATYEDVRNALENEIKTLVLEDPTKYGWEIITRPIHNNLSSPMSEVSSSYCYVYMKKMFVDEKKVIASVEYNGCENRKFLEVYYTLDKDNKPKISSMDEVDEKVTYEKKVVSKPTSVGEMNKEEEEKSMSDFKNLTIEDVMANQQVYSAIRKSIASEMDDENSHKMLVLKAGEMDEICNLIGGEQDSIVDTVKKIVNFNSKFVGEMSAIFVGESDEDLTPDEIIDATKDAVDTISAVKEVVKVDEDGDVVEKVKQVVEENSTVSAKEAITDVKAEFDKLIAEVKDETVAEFVKDDFSDILDATSDDIEDVEAWKQEALDVFTEHFESSVEKYTKRLEKAFGKGKAVGEMNALEDLGTNLGSHNTDSNEGDPDIAEAKRLGYGI